MSQSAEDALKALKAKIESRIEETKNSIRACVAKENYALAFELSIKIYEREDIVDTIDEMLNELEKEEKHTHLWKWQSDIGFHCYCGIILSMKEVEKRLNSDNIYVGGQFTAYKLEEYP